MLKSEQKSIAETNKLMEKFFASFKTVLISPKFCYIDRKSIVVQKSIYSSFKVQLKALLIKKALFLTRKASLPQVKFSKFFSTGYWKVVSTPSFDMIERIVVKILTEKAKIIVV